MAKREKTPLEKMSTRDLVRKIQKDLRRKMEEIGFEPAEASAAPSVSQQKRTQKASSSNLRGTINKRLPFVK
ncbi:MAG TPA: hypothetical protein VN911_06095 [Candidatus Acidoferrum sp.]|nr:hypothetical protein [Candidatus Acidoferrum sp.]